jgi:hypothetical protein
LARCHGWIDFVAVGGLGTERCGGEDAFDRFWRGHVHEDWLVFEEGGYEEETRWYQD